MKSRSFWLLVVGCESLVVGGSMNAPLKIQFERSGGFAGMKIRFLLEDKDLSEDEREQLWEMLQQAKIFNKKPQAKPLHASIDRFTYRLTVANGDQEYMIEMEEGNIPQEMRPLLEYLNLRARQAIRRR